MENKGYTVSIDVSMTPELRGRIWERAAQTGVKPAAWVRETLEWVLNNVVLDSEKGNDNERIDS